MKKQTYWEAIHISCFMLKVKLKKVIFFLFRFESEYSFLCCFNKLYKTKTESGMKSGMFLPFMLNTFTTVTKKKH